MERDKRRLINNFENDALRLLVRGVKTLLYIAFGALIFSFYYSPVPGEVTCRHEVIVELTGTTTYIIPSLLPKTGADE